MFVVVKGIGARFVSKKVVKVAQKVLLERTKTELEEIQVPAVKITVNNRFFTVVSDNTVIDKIQFVTPSKRMLLQDACQKLGIDYGKVVVAAYQVSKGVSKLEVMA